MTAGHDIARDTPPRPATPSSVLRSRVAWTSRNLSSLSDVQRYTRFVGVMKRALPMAAAVLLAAVLAYALQPRQQGGKRQLTFQMLRMVSNDLMMTKPRLTGIDSGGNPFVVTAARAIQDIHDTKSARLEEVEADLTLKNGTWLNATATRGHLNELPILGHSGKKQTEYLHVEGVVDVYSDNGYEAHTSAADIDLTSGVVVGARPVNGQGPLGIFRADRFRIERDTKLVFLYGNVRMTLNIHKPNLHKAARA
jgi:lipopolysaccharide export system protein LptC